MHNSTKQTLRKIYNLILEEDELEAKNLFLSLKLVDTAEHLSFVDSERYLIWDLYEYLILKNIQYINREQLISELESYLVNE